jgi:hypothetical protein
MNTNTEHLRADLLARLGEAAGIAEAAALRLETAEAFDATQLTRALGDLERATALMRQLLARLPSEDGPTAASDGERPA